MIRAMQNIEGAPPELGYLIWRWLQEESFKIKGRAYLILGESSFSGGPHDYDIKIAVHWNDPNVTVIPEEGTRNSIEQLLNIHAGKWIEIYCKGSKIKINKKSLSMPYLTRRYGGPPIFDAANPRNFQSCLTLIRRLLRPGPHKTILENAQRELLEAKSPCRVRA